MTDLLVPHENYFTENKDLIVVPDYPPAPPTKIHQTVLWSPWQRAEKRIEKLNRFRSPKELAQFFERLEIHGIPHNPSHCPVAVYVAGDLNLRASAVPATRQPGDITLSTPLADRGNTRTPFTYTKYTLSKTVNTFIFRFDMGFYRFLLDRET